MSVVQSRWLAYSVHCKIQVFCMFEIFHVTVNKTCLFKPLFIRFSIICYQYSLLTLIPKQGFSTKWMRLALTLTHSFNKHLLDTYHVLDLVLLLGVWSCEQKRPRCYEFYNLAEMANIYYHTNKHITTVITITKEPFWGPKAMTRGPDLRRGGVIR